MVQGKTITATLAAAGAVWLMTGGAAFGQQMLMEYDQVLETLGRQGDFKESALTVNIPRSDLWVGIDGIPTPTLFGFGGWLAMTKGDGGIEVMIGELVFLEGEVNPVLFAPLDNGLEITAMHNHFFFENHRIFYMHVHGHGKAADWARLAKPAVDLIGRGNPKHLYSASGGAAGVSSGQIDTAKIAKIAGHEGERNGAEYQITVGWKDLKPKERGAAINLRMGLNPWAAFDGSDAKAEVAGEVAVLSQQVTPVLNALQANGLNVVAVHHHMMGTQPSVYFLHYWGTGPAETAATGFKAALKELGRQ